MKKNKELPYIEIVGTGNGYSEQIDSLIQFEPILIMLGYSVSSEEWNNHRCSLDTSSDYNCVQTILACNNMAEYHNRTAGFVKTFSVKNKQKIINYILNYDN